MNARMERILTKAKSKVWNAGYGLLNEEAFRIVAEMIMQECAAKCDEPGVHTKFDMVAAIKRDVNVA